MLNFSKSKYCGLWQCPKIAWLNKYKSEERHIDESTLSRMENGNAVGDLAMQLFGEFNEVTAYTDGKIDLVKMQQLTEQYIAEGRDNICEASFIYNGLYCAVDILRKTKRGYAIFEVKSSTHEDNYIYIVDIAYQRYVMEKCGVNVTSTYLINIDSSYVRGKELDVNKLFKITDVTKWVKEEQRNTEDYLAKAELLLQSDTEPPIDISENCNDPYGCSYWNYCTKHVPKPSVFDLYRLPFKKKLDCYHKGILTYEDVVRSQYSLNHTQSRQIDFALHDKATYVDKKQIKEFLDTLSYPTYFLDFETIQPVIPEFEGTRPYQQIPFQYSLHYIEREGGGLQHKEFLAQSGVNPLRPIAESLVKDIPTDVCVLAYNKAFECTRLKELAETFPDLASRLLKIRDNIKDLLDPFRQGAYYNKAMGGSFSIKSVLPAMFPGDLSLDYHNLEGVHNGGEAMSIYPKIKDMQPEEQQIARHNLLKYCELDTYAMVKIWQELVKITKE